MPLNRRVFRVGWLAILLASLSPWVAFGQSALVWEHKQLEVRPALGDKQAKAEFDFTNASPHPVSIDSVRSSCGCTTATLDKKSYAPGEKGRVTAVFSVGRNRGTLTKGIQVNVHGEANPTVLFLIARIPELVKIDPQLLVWNTGEAPQPKTIALSVSPEKSMRLLKATSSNPAIAAALETVKEGREYALVVHPKTTDKPMFAVLTVELTADSKEIPQQIQAYAKIMGPRN